MKKRRRKRRRSDIEWIIIYSGTGRGGRTNPHTHYNGEENGDEPVTLHR